MQENDHFLELAIGTAARDHGIVIDVLGSKLLILKFPCAASVWGLKSQQCWTPDIYDVVSLCCPDQRTYYTDYALRNIS